MSEEIKNIKKETEKVNPKAEDKKGTAEVIAYKKVSELNEDDFSKMETCIVNMITKFDKKTSTESYKLVFKPDNGMQVEKYITRNDYLITCLKRKLDQNELLHSFQVPIRFVKGDYGKNNDDAKDYWIRMDAIIAGGYIVSHFLNGNDKYCVKVLGKDFGYTLIESPESLDKYKTMDKDVDYTVSY